MASPRVLLLLLFLSHRCPRGAESRRDQALGAGGRREIGREEFTLGRDRARGAAGTTLMAVARYPAGAPTTRLSRRPRAHARFRPRQVSARGRGPDGTTVILAAGSGARLIVRTVAKGSESGRELPGGPDVVLLDDGVYSLYTAVAELATPSGRQLTGDLPADRPAGLVRRSPRTGGEGGTSSDVLSGDVTRHFGDRRERPAPAPGAAWPQASRSTRRHGVGPFSDNSFSTVRSGPLSQAETSATGPAYWARSRLTPKGPFHDSLARSARAGWLLPVPGAAQDTTQARRPDTTAALRPAVASRFPWRRRCSRREPTVRPIARP